MADKGDKPRPFDTGTLKALMEMMSAHDVSELDLAEGEEKIRIRRGPRVVAGAMAAPVVQAAPVVTANPQAGAEKAPAPAAAPSKKLIEIKSQAVGTFYAQREPGSPPFVSVGSKITHSTVVCIIEAMKVMNDVQAEVAGTIAEVCVKNKDFVEYNTVLFRVDPAG